LFYTNKNFFKHVDSHLIVEFVKYSNGTWKSISWGRQGVSAQGPPNVGYKLTSELRLRPRVVRSAPRARETRFGSVSAARINVKSPIIPNWSVTIEGGMFVTSPEKKEIKIIDLNNGLLLLSEHKTSKIFK
jgi:hypothetical protein